MLSWELGTVLLAVSAHDEDHLRFHEPPAPRSAFGY